MKKFFYYILIALFSININLFGQEDNRIRQIENNLEVLKVDNPGLNEMVELSVSGASIQDFLRGIATTNELNISVDPSIDLQVVNNFTNVSVADILIFLAKQYKLDYEFTGSIIYVSKYSPKINQLASDTIKVSYLKSNNLLSIDVNNLTLNEVVKDIVEKSQKNVVLAPGIADRRVSAYIKNLEFDEALENFAFSNELVVQLDDDEEDVFILQLKSVAEKNNKGPNFIPFSETGNLNLPSNGINLSVENRNDISVFGENIPLSDLVKTISSQIKVNYYFQDKVEGSTSVKLANYTYDEVLRQLFIGTEYTFKKEKGVYLIGKRNTEGLRKTSVYPLQHRTVENIIQHIPTALTQNVEIKEFNDLNSLVLNGSAPVINELSSYLDQIDQIVPVVAIEVIIVDYSKSRSLRTGLTAGIGDAPVTSGGQILPGVNYNLGAETINSIIRDLNSGGAVNLGQVSPNFYMQLEALESDGIVDVRSTPKLATLNGHEATLSIGSTEYYVVESNTVIGTQNPQTQFQRQFQSVNADLSVTIKPFVSGDDQITLEISVDQNDFTDRIEPDAPPNSVNRSFSSILRVKNQEMILLGGLELKSKTKGSSGIPILARIPVLKWIFARQIREKQDSKLNILIKPTVLY